MSRKSDVVSHKSDAVSRKSDAVSHKSDAVSHKSDAVSHKSDTVLNKPYVNSLPYVCADHLDFFSLYFAYCQGFLPCLFLPSGPFTCIFSKTSPDFFLCWLWLTHGSRIGP